ncbi:c-type cytochrome [Jiella sp. M17.18]|uniref:c-type cytochrome n=1 Tax=Jiella sp. M17.18 TaxID=3234247 RepID=UPI0034DE055A
MLPEHKTAAALAAVFLAASTVAGFAQPAGKGSPAEPLGIGTKPSDALVKAWNIDIAPDGKNLPDGSGSVSQGQKIFAGTCAACHGEKGQGGEGMIGGRLVGGKGTLATDKPVKTVGSYWPYATTLYDYVHRAMPFNAPQSLTPDQVYAVSAYVLNLNGIVPDDAVMDRNTLPKVEMPNRDGFVQMDTKTLAKTTACMKDCKPLVGRP